MRCGLAAAVLVLSLMAVPVVAEPELDPVASGPASAALAAAKAAKAAATQAAPAAVEPTPTPMHADPAAQATAEPAAKTTAVAPGTGDQQAAAHDAVEGPPVPLTTPTADEVAAENAASADSPPAQQAAVAPAPELAAPASAVAAPEPKAAAASDKAQPPASGADAAQPVVEKPKVVAAKTLFGAAKEPAPLAARAIGTYARGCLSGAKPLAVDGPTWQAMRLSRNRTWGHPDLITLLERFAGEVKDDGWPGLLVGDISQPRGGPMLTGHASHQLGLDADIWFTPMPDRRLSKKERETLSATSMLAADSLSVDPKVWTESRVKIIKRVASYGKVERVLVHPAIKKALCQAAGPNDRAWLNKVRPYWGHFYHFHVRIGCPGGSPGCKAQAPVPGDDGCGKELDDWYNLLTRKPKPRPPGEPKIVKPVKPKPPITLADLPTDCSDVLAAGTSKKLPTPAPAVASTTGGAAKKADGKQDGKATTAKPKPPAAKPSAVKPAAGKAATKSAASDKTAKQ